eukprot:8180983-Pyramimonas_sp.AAC.1
MSKRFGHPTPYRANKIDCQPAHCAVRSEQTDGLREKGRCEHSWHTSHYRVMLQDARPDRSRFLG